MEAQKKLLASVYGALMSIAGIGAAIIAMAMFMPFAEGMVADDLYPITDKPTVSETVLTVMRAVRETRASLMPPGVLAMMGVSVIVVSAFAAWRLVQYSTLTARDTP